MAFQRRNSEMVDILSADFVRNLAGTVSYQHLSNDFQVKNSVASGEAVTIAAGYQRLAWGSFTISGTVTVEGDLVVL